jgi:glutamate formiminotransferase / 5-formyltetrahydrofolate cyclo-ligase
VPARGTSFECVVNISEGRDRSVIDAIASAGGEHLLDRHSDAEHHRSVLTLGGPLDTVEAAARAVAAVAVAAVDIRTHVGVHPRRGAVDVVPFVPLGAAAPDGDAWCRALQARDRFAEWAGSELGVPCFLYGPERTLPDIRRHAFSSLTPDSGPPAPHPTAGATAVGVRPVLVAYNVWIADRSGGVPDDVLSVARALAAGLRGPSVRSLGLPLASGAQVSCNLIDPSGASITKVYDTVAAGARAQGYPVVRAELVGLVPEATLLAVPRPRWAEMDLGEDRTIEYRMVERGTPIDGG